MALLIPIRKIKNPPVETSGLNANDVRRSYTPGMDALTKIGARTQQDVKLLYKQ